VIDLIDGLREADPERVVEYRNTEGAVFRAQLGPRLQQVASHATHHQSEIATMMTMISASPPHTGLLTYG